MKKSAGPLIVGCMAVLCAFYAWTHLGRVAKRAAVPAAITAPAPDASYAEADLANQMVTVTGPLADHILHQQPTVVKTASPVAHDVAASDRVRNSASPAGSPVLRQTIGVSAAANLTIEVPAHAASPKLRGTYQAFVRQSGTQSDEVAEVEFLLLNERQYDDFLGGHLADALFSNGSAHEQEIDFSLPPTFDKSAKYYLVFRNGPASTQGKIVQADFRIDF